MVKQVQFQDVRQWKSLQDQGYKPSEIGSQTGWSPATIRKYLKTFYFMPEAWFVASAFDDLSLLSDIRRRHQLLIELLTTEKRRRNVASDKLVFLGIANVAEYFYCAMQSVFKSRENEVMFYLSYMHDRMHYTKRLGRPLENPTTPDDLLNIGKDIDLNDIERLLDQIKKLMRMSYTLDMEPSRPDDTNSPLKRGEHLHKTKAESYPRIRWNFESNGYVLVGVPDGITSDFVYEFKTSQNPFLMSYLKPVAFAQADLYGYFFRREKKRVQLYTVESSTTETFEEPIDKDKVERVLREFRQIEEGWSPQPPAGWKCKKCKFRDVCTIKVE